MKKKIFLIGIILVFVFSLSILCSCGAKKLLSKDKNAEFTWPTTGLATMLPTPENTKGKIATDSESRFSIDIYDMTQEQFNEYKKECKERGFTINISELDSVLYANNADRYELGLIYSDYSSELSIYLNAPEEIVDINWPNSILVSQLPIPESTKGYISTESSKYFSVYIANTNNDQFNAYIENCRNYGFTEDYSREDGYYRAYNQGGYKLTLELDKGFDIMNIYITAPEENVEEITEATTQQEETTNSEAQNNDIVDDGTIRPEIKEAIDSYEAFVDEYCSFIDNYNSNDASQLMSYLELLNKEIDMSNKFNDLEPNLNAAESLYYSEVSLRCSQKLLATALK